MSKPSPSPSDSPGKAYLVKYKIVNEADAIVYAHNAKDAVARFEAGEAVEQGATGVDYRIGRPTAKRWPEEDLDG